MTDFMPKFQDRLVDAQGRITPSWRDYLRRLTGATSLAEVWAAIEDIRRQLADDGPGSFLPSTSNVLGLSSVRTYGELRTGNVTVQLDGDATTPGPNRYYGTGDDGLRGFHERRLDTLADVDAGSPSVGDGLVWNGSAWAAQPVASTGGYLPLTTGEITGDQPVFVYGPDGRLIYAPVT